MHSIYIYICEVSGSSVSVSRLTDVIVVQAEMGLSKSVFRGIMWS